VKIIKEGADYWATILAAGTTPETQSEAEAINARSGGWAYKLPDWKAQIFATRLESLLKPKTGQASTPSRPSP
jgi:hypothetical protein